MAIGLNHAQIGNIVHGTLLSWGIENMLAMHIAGSVADALSRNNDAIEGDLNRVLAIVEQRLQQLEQRRR